MEDYPENALNNGASMRPALKELQINEMASHTNGKSSKQPNQLAEVRQGENLIKEENNFQLKDDKADLSNFDEKRFEVNSLKDICSTSILPDIVNVQPKIATDSSDPNDSLVSQLTASLNNLQIDQSTGPDSNSLQPNALSHEGNSGISSDDETFTECQSYIENTLGLNDTEVNRRSIQWDNVVSSVSSQNVETIDSSTLDAVELQEIITLDCVNVTISAPDSTTVSELDSVANDLLHQIIEIKPIQSNPIDEEMKQSSNEIVNETFGETIEITSTNEDCPIDALIDSGVETNLSESNKFVTESLTPTDTHNEFSKSNSNENNMLNPTANQTADESLDILVNAVESSSDTPKNLVPITTSGVSSLDQTFDNKEFSLATYDITKITNSGRLSTTFAPSSEALNSTANFGLRAGGALLNNTFDHNNPTGLILPQAEGNLLNTSIDNSPQSFDGTYDTMGDSIEHENLEKCNKNLTNAEIVNTTINLDQFGASNSIPFPLETPAIQIDQFGDPSSDQEDVVSANNMLEPMDVDMSFSIESSPVKSGNCTEPSIDIDSKCQPMESEKKIFNPFSKRSEKDVFVENFVSDQFNVTFKAPTGAPPKRRSQEQQPDSMAENEELRSNDLILNPSDFDFLLSKGNNNIDFNRDSLLLRFDPLLGCSVPSNQQQWSNNNNSNNISSHNSNNTSQNLLPTKLVQSKLTPTLEEEDQQSIKHTSSVDSSKSTELIINLQADFAETNNQEKLNSNQEENQVKSSPVRIKTKKDNICVTDTRIKKNGKMSVDVIHDIKTENDVKSFDNIDSQCDDKQEYKMAELEKKIKNEVLKTEDVEKKLKDAEQREEALLKRITEKDKTIAKINSVMAEYEKAIAEIIAEKEQIVQNYEKQLADIKSERDLNYQHLMSMETTFSDLHAKYERGKQITAALKVSEESLLAERKQNAENLRLQEQRYEKMKSHAMQQLEIANNKLESLTKNHGAEVTKLKALLKKEEISRLSINEQLQQKTRENEELLKICDELINGQGS